MADKNILMQRKKGDGTYDAYYPQTKVANVAGAAKQSDLEALAGPGRTTETVKGNADALTSHKADDVSQGEVHGLRVENEKLEYYTGTEWKIASGGIPVGNVSGLSIEEGDAEITLMWTDPEDRYLDDLKIAEWQGTKIVRKEGSYPVSDDDGTLVVDNKTRNQYSTNGYKDTGLTNLVTYYYMAFPYTEDAITVDGANRIVGTPTDADDPSGSPGSPNLIAGDMNAGFFGEVPASELFTASEIASACGISQGTAQFENEPWLKFALDGKILFRPRKSIRHSISWNSINTANCVYGGSEGKRVTKDGQTYIVRLMKGALTDPSLYDASDRGAKGSEWNRLMLPIHEQAIDKSWAYSAYVEDNIPIWNHNLGTGANGMYTDADLMTHNSHGNGSYSWCQETRNTDAAWRVGRGFGGVSGSGAYTASDSSANRGWSPVLELI